MRRGYATKTKFWDKRENLDNLPPSLSFPICNCLLTDNGICQRSITHASLAASLTITVKVQNLKLLILSIFLYDYFIITSLNIRRLLSRLSLFALTFLTSRGRMCESMSRRVREDKVSMREAVAKSLSWLPMLSSCLAKESMSFPVTGLDI